MVPAQPMGTGPTGPEMFLYVCVVLTTLADVIQALVALTG